MLRAKWDIARAHSVKGQPPRWLNWPFLIALLVVAVVSESLFAVWLFT
ncbi:hypothetical protein EV385_0508 [Krasilnikovia cinnamomea]|uniref:Uncharacterized protein n=1 Tax=Krasilnikovia cinnamomea TaxID=349313 RepID=A0A4Q7ZER9_9ACTN|nr:hypothetical protein [Krasilnikovia cinnamomea]RZU48784.1 hypothetical protein EV385_0508 [Krasilnikovia cinnamomea]